MEKTLKSKFFVLQNAFNLFGTDCIVSFDSGEQPMNSFRNKMNVSAHSINKVAENLMKYLENKFPEVFSEGLGKCTKTKVKSEVKENGKPIFKPKRNLLFTILELINKELKMWVSSQKSSIWTGRLQQYM